MYIIYIIIYIRIHVCIYVHIYIYIKNFALENKYENVWCYIVHTTILYYSFKQL